MKEILVEELKQIQLNMLNILHDFCIANGIKYSLTYGTLIGAIRHNGFIPWDDDIDVFMTRPEYEKFKQSFRHRYIAFADINTDSSCNVTYGKLYDTRTEIHEYASVNWNSGIYIDLFVIDGLGNDYKTAKIHYNKLSFLRKVRDFKIVKFNKSRSTVKNIALFVGKLFLAPFSFQSIQKRIVELKSKYDYSNSKYAADLSWGTYRRILPKDVFESYVTHKFEERDYMIIQAYDLYLTTVFGDYMQLPPLEKRVTHHVFNAWWKTETSLFN